MDKIIELIYTPYTSNWTKQAEDAFGELYGAASGRYPKSAEKSVKLRNPQMSPDSGVPFASLIHTSNPDSGAYGGMSFVLFPITDGPAMVALVVGTQGLNPDEDILSKPGHARKVCAICNMLNSGFGSGSMLAWAKQDPVRTEKDVPDDIVKLFIKYKTVFQRYGKVIYGIFAPNANKDATSTALYAFMDLMYEERGFQPLQAHKENYEDIRFKYFQQILPNISIDQILSLLDERRFVIIEGPPGTGKTRMANLILKDHYHSNGFSVQFHPNITYENFVGGLAPIATTEGMGFRFQPLRGFLIEAIKCALDNPNKKVLLNIDEINRADLAKVLGEAIFLFEAREFKREIQVPYDYGKPFGNIICMPPNLHVLGTMNSADRSIAILDVAIRRRFAFIKLWPQINVLKEFGACDLMVDAFIKTLNIFIEQSTDDSFSLVPGHSYFLEKDKGKAIEALNIYLIPLLEEYLMQGYVNNFADDIVAHIQWIKSLR